MKGSKLIFAQLYVCAIAVYLGLSVYIGIIEKAGENNMVITSVTLGFVFAAILFVGAVGIFGALITQISKNKREFALRLAAGATQSDIIKDFMLRWLLKIAMLPVALGLISVRIFLAGFKDMAASVMGFALQTDFYVFAFSFLIILCFSFVIAIYPAYKAANTDILKTLAA